MLGARKFNRQYIESCREKINTQLLAFERLKTALQQVRPAQHHLHIALEDFEYIFFSSLIVVMDTQFVHRIRSIEPETEGALNEVRLLSNAILHHHGCLTEDLSIQYHPQRSLLRFEIGREIVLTSADFTIIKNAFFNELEERQNAK